MAGRGSGGSGRRLLVVLIVLAGLLVGADRGGDFVAERIAAESLKSSQHLAAAPEVDVAGIPFLTQFAAGHYQRITIDARDLATGSGRLSLRFSALHVVLHSLTVSRDFHDFHADTADGDATVTYPEVSRLLGVGVRYDGGGRISATKSITILGNTIRAGISAKPALVNGALGFGASAVNGLGQLTAEALRLLKPIFDVSVPLDRIPFQVSVRSLTADRAGLHLAVTGADLSYAR